MKVRFNKKVNTQLFDLNSKLAYERNHFELKSLQSIMNPHFISNCLASLQRYIIVKDIDSSVVYLSHFGKLMRMYFKQSTKDFVPLNEALDLIEIYVAMEKVRYAYLWNFSLVVDDHIDANNSTIPPMLIQPFVENAIWHGLKEKKRGGSVVVSLNYVNDHTIKCSITDNGSGRSVSDSKNKTIHSTDITEKRLEKLWEGSNQDHKITFVDLKSATGGPLGTRVEFYIPMEF